MYAGANVQLFDQSENFIFKLLNGFRGASAKIGINYRASKPTAETKSLNLSTYEHSKTIF